MLYQLSKLLPQGMLSVGFSLILLYVGLIGFCRWSVTTAVVLLQGFFGVRDRESDLVALVGNALATNHRSCSYFC